MLSSCLLKLFCRKIKRYNMSLNKLFSKKCIMVKFLKTTQKAGGLEISGMLILSFNLHNFLFS